MALFALLLSIFLSLSFNSCVATNGYGEKHVCHQEFVESDMKLIDYHSLGLVKEGRIVVNKDVDLNNGICYLPKDYTLEIKGSIVSNGTLVGNNSKLLSKNPVFDNVIIKGDWYVPVISSSLFKRLDTVNSLVNVFALTNPSIHNKVIIEEGDYYVNAFKDWDSCVRPCSNTDVIIKGNIILVPNSLIGCYVIGIYDDNITIRGKGSIIGDRLNHRGEKGEWGMGINIEESNNIRIQGITIKDCWGDCIYVGGNSKNIIIRKANICKGRRQGISITSADGVTITNCSITDVIGTDPECAIDAEPNEGDTVNNVLIKNVRITNCKGGILVYGNAHKSVLTNVIIRGNAISTMGKSTIGIIGAESILVERNHLVQTIGSKVVTLKDVDGVEIIKNNLQCYKEQMTVDSQLLVSSNCKRLNNRRNKEKTF